jgi:two-component system, NarL family, invasion response regulator UvrY
LNILIATPFPEFRRDISTLLRDNFEIGVVGQAEDGAEALRLLHSHAWDVALLGVRLRHGGGLHFLHIFKTDRPKLPVVMVSYEPHAIVVGSSLDAGACGYVMQNDLAQELVPSIRAALAGEVYLSAAITKSLKGNSAHTGVDGD